MQQYKIRILKKVYAVCKLSPEAEFPDWVNTGELLCMTRTAHELTIICEEDIIPEDTIKEGGWRAFFVDAVLDFELIGVLASILNPLAEAGISIFALSTYTTDYFLVRTENLEVAVRVLAQAGFDI